MKTALVISSFVAASRVGASASSFCLRRLGIETATLPTTLLGRHPGWGPPGGSAVKTDTLEGMWDGVQAQNIKFDAVLTGYMASRGQVCLAADIIRSVKADNPDALIMVDPVMGDSGKLYVDETIAGEIKSELIQLADVITPNVWELGFLTGQSVETLNDIIKAAQSVGKDTVVTSVPEGDKIGAAYVSRIRASLVSHKKFSAIPHGGGDTLAGTLLAHILKGLPAEDALAKAVAGVFDIINTAIDTDAGELPLIRRQAALETATSLPIQRLTL